MIKEDFKISGDSAFFAIFWILIIACIVSYHRGRMDQKSQDDQQWTEDMILGKNLPITQQLKKGISYDKGN